MSRTVKADLPGATADSSRLWRWSRLGLVLATLIMLLALMLPSWLGYTGAISSSNIVARGQGQALMEAISGQLRATSSRPTVEDLQEILEVLRPSGLQFLFVHTRPAISAGEAQGPAIVGKRRLGPSPMTRVGNRVRMNGIVAPSRAARRRPMGRAARRRPPLPLVIEFSPGPAHQLVSRARTSLMVNGAVASCLLLAAGLLFFYLRKMEQEQTQRARERHLASLGEMSAVLAHELRNPLTSLKGHAQLLEEMLEQSPNKQAKAKRVVADAIRLETLTNNLLDFVRTGSIDRQEVNPVAIAERARKQVSSECIQIDSQGAPELWQLDADRMQQALINLFRNAVQACEQAGVQAGVQVRIYLESKTLYFEVRDEGPGIAPQDLPKIFQAFHTTKTQGTGLGLAIASRVVELHGGVLSAHNAQGPKEVGALFRIAIPEHK